MIPLKGYDIRKCSLSDTFRLQAGNRVLTVFEGDKITCYYNNILSMIRKWKYYSSAYLVTPLQIKKCLIFHTC